MRIEHYFFLLGAISLAPTMPKLAAEILGICAVILGIFFSLKG